MDDTPSAVGNGRGTQTNTIIKQATTGKKDTRLASHGLPKEVRKAPFIGGPHACRAPAAMISG